MLEVNDAAVLAAQLRIQRGQYASHTLDRYEMPGPGHFDQLVDKYGLEEWSSWFLAIDRSRPEDELDRFQLPYGDLTTVKKSWLMLALEEAEREGNYTLESAIRRLLVVLDED